MDIKVGKSFPSDYYIVTAYIDYKKGSQQLHSSVDRHIQEKNVSDKGINLSIEIFEWDFRS
jgi:hypothetical protein